MGELGEGEGDGVHVGDPRDQCQQIDPGVAHLALQESSHEADERQQQAELDGGGEIQRVAGLGLHRAVGQLLALAPEPERKAVDGDRQQQQGGCEAHRQLVVDQQHQHQQPQPHGGPRQQYAGSQQPLQPALLLVEAGKLQGEGGGGGEPCQHAGEHQPGAGTEQAHREVAAKRDARDDHHHQPDLEGVECIERPYLLVGQHRQQYQGDEQKAQGGVKFGFAQKQHALLDLALEPHQQGRQHGAGHRLARAQQYRHQAQQIGEQHGCRAGEAELPLPALGQPDR